MRYLLVFLSTLLLTPCIALPVITFYEEFGEPVGWMGSTNPPNGWTIEDDGIPDENDWFQDEFVTDDYGAHISSSPSEIPMIESLFRSDLDCDGYNDIELNYWLKIDWNVKGTYSGFFYVIGSSDQFQEHSSILFLNSWPNCISDTISQYLPIWADFNSQVGLKFFLITKDSRAVKNIWLDKVSLDCTCGSSGIIQPTSLGKVKAKFKDEGEIPFGLGFNSNNGKSLTMDILSSASEKHSTEDKNNQPLIFNQLKSLYD